MSQEELVGAYVEGRMSRRLFVRRLVAGGMALGTAISYAHLLTPERSDASARGCADELYDPPLFEMVPEPLERIIRERRVRVRGTVSQPACFVVYLHLFRPPSQTDYPDATLGALALDFQQANTPTTFSIPLNEPHAVIALNGQRRAEIGVHRREGDVDPASSNAIVYERQGDFSPRPLTLRMVPDDLDDVIAARRVRVRAMSSMPGTFPAYIHLYRSPARSPWPDAVIGFRGLTFSTAHRFKTFAVPLSANGILALEKQRRSARIGVHPSDLNVTPSLANAILYER